MKKREKKAAVIGVYGSGADFTTGQAVKCHELIDWMRERYGADEIRVVNTYQWKKHPARLLASLVGAFLRCRNVIMLPAQNGIQVFAPLVYYLRRIFGRSVHYVVIGGWLAETLQCNGRMRRWVSSYDGVYAETRRLEGDLKRLGVKNSRYLPNFRTRYEGNEKTETWESPIPVCTYSRVVKEKGIEDAVEIVRSANGRMGFDCFRLDVYGKVDFAFQEEFSLCLETNQQFVRYCGVKEFNEGAETLSSYFALLFPTYYAGECLAGTLLDAFAAGIPTIANDWKDIREIIEPEENGVIYPFRDVEQAARELCRLYEERALYERVKEGCKKSAYRYSTDRVLEEFAKKLS